jgi:hypothetical protein
VSGRLDFSDRRARALESVVQYRPGTGPAAELPETAAPAQTGGQPARRESDQAAGGGAIKGEAQRARRRRRRRGRGGAAGPPAPGTPVESEPGGADNAFAGGAEAADARGGADSLPFDGGEPGPAQAPAPDAGEPTDQ